MADWGSILSGCCSPAALGNILYMIVAVEGQDSCILFDKYPHLSGLAPYWKRAFRSQLTLREYFDGLNQLTSVIETKYLIGIKETISNMLKCPDHYPVKTASSSCGAFLSKSLAEMYGDFGYVMGLLNPALLKFSHDIGVNCVGEGNSLEEILDVLGQSVRESSERGEFHEFFRVVTREPESLLDDFAFCSCVCMHVEFVSLFPLHYEAYMKAFVQLASRIGQAELAEEIGCFIPK